jgi:dolichyl-diphosphooligosaccharide--protein glycosyltransferase
MGIKDLLSKEHVVDGIKSLGKLRIKVSHGSIITFSALMLILFIAFVVRIFPMRWEIQTGSMHLSEFDPYFQYRFTEYIVKNGFISWAWPTQWVDTYRWYPDGINVARTGYPGLPFTAAFLYNIVSALGANIDLMDFCAFLPAIMGMMACFAIYFLGKDFGGTHVGLFAAIFLALSPSYLQRTSLGFFDDEIIGIFSFVLFLITFLRAIEEDRPAISSFKYAIGSGLVLGYFCAGWGAAFYPIGATVLFVFVLILLKRYTQRLLLSYSLTFGLGLFIAINVPRLAPVYLTTAPMLPVAGVLVLLCIYEVSRALAVTKWKVIFIIAFLAMLIVGFSVLWQLGYMQNVAGKFWSVINPFIREISPLTESVAEHRITAWGSIYYEFGVGILFFVAGFFFIVRNLNNRNLFLLILGLTSIYFASSMVRLLVLVAPIFGLLSGIGITGILKPFITLLKEPPKILTKKKYSLEHVGKEFSGTAVFLIFIVLMTNFAFSPQYGGMPKVLKQAYAPITITAASLPLVPSEPITVWMDALIWMKNNLPATTIICSWWDYGYWLTILGNVTSLADNATINGTQIGLIGRTYLSNETQSVRILKEQFNGPNGPPTYILVFATFYSTSQDANYGGDEGKWTWMARIANSSRTVRELYEQEWGVWEYNEWGTTSQNNTFGSYNSTTGMFDWNDLGQNTTIYKIMENAKSYLLYSTLGYTAPELTYFKNPHFFGGQVAMLGTTSSGTTVYLDALVCLYEVDYAKYDSDNQES